MCRVDWCDGDDVFLGEQRPKARKQHRCDDCRRTIEPGEQYRVARWVVDGSISTSKMCAHCSAAARWLKVVCRGWVWGEVIEELREHWDEEYALRSHGLARLSVVGRRRWQRRDVLIDVATVEKWVDSALARVPQEAKAS